MRLTGNAIRQIQEEREKLQRAVNLLDPTYGVKERSSCNIIYRLDISKWWIKRMLYLFDTVDICYVGLLERTAVITPCNGADRSLDKEIIKIAEHLEKELGLEAAVSL